MRFQEPKANNNSRQNKIKFMTTGVRLMSHTLTLLFSSRAIYIYIYIYLLDSIQNLG